MQHNIPNIPSLQGTAIQQYELKESTHSAHKDTNHRNQTQKTFVQVSYSYYFSTIRPGYPFSTHLKGFTRENFVSHKENGRKSLGMG